MNLLDEIVEAQLESQYDFRRIYRDDSHGCTPYCEDMEGKFKDNVLYMISEAVEVLNEINFKKHVLRKRGHDREKIKEELIDVFKFWLNLCLLFDVTADEIYDMFFLKTAKVKERMIKETTDAEERSD